MGTSSRGDGGGGSQGLEAGPSPVQGAVLPCEHRDDPGAGRRWSPCGRGVRSCIASGERTSKRRPGVGGQRTWKAKGQAKGEAEEDGEEGEDREEGHEACREEKGEKGSKGEEVSKSREEGQGKSEEDKESGSEGSPSDCQKGKEKN